MENMTASASIKKPTKHYSKQVLLMCLTPGGTRTSVNFELSPLSETEHHLSPREIKIEMTDSKAASSDSEQSVDNDDEEIDQGLAALATPEKLNMFYSNVIDESQRIDCAELAVCFFHALLLQPLLQDLENLKSFFNLFKDNDPKKAKKFLENLAQEIDLEQTLKEKLMVIREAVFSKTSSLGFLSKRVIGANSPSKLRGDSAELSTSSDTDSDTEKDPTRALFQEDNIKCFSRRGSSSG